MAPLHELSDALRAHITAIAKDGWRYYGATFMPAVLDGGIESVHYAQHADGRLHPLPLDKWRVTGGLARHETPYWERI